MSFDIPAIPAAGRLAPPAAPRSPLPALDELRQQLYCWLVQHL